MCFWRWNMRAGGRERPLRTFLLLALYAKNIKWHSAEPARRVHSLRCKLLACDAVYNCWRIRTYRGNMLTYWELESWRRKQHVPSKHRYLFMTQRRRPQSGKSPKWKPQNLYDSTVTQSSSECYNYVQWLRFWWAHSILVTCGSTHNFCLNWGSVSYHNHNLQRSLQ
jgi:hypothetical protein